MSFLRRLRGAFGKAAVWAGTWFTASAAFFGSVWMLGGVTVVEGPAIWRLVGALAAGIGATGFATGLGFSAWLRLRHVDRPLLDISVRGTAIVGALGASAISLGLGAAVRLGIGRPLVLLEILAGTPMAAVLGAVTAGGSLYLAQRSERALAAAPTAELERELGEARALLGSESG